MRLRSKPRVKKHCPRDHGMQIDWLTCPKCTGAPALIRRNREIDQTVLLRRGATLEPVAVQRPERCLIVLEGDRAGTVHELRFGRWKVGRAPRPEADTELIRINDDYASLEHFALEIDPAAWLLRDLKSLNGTWVNGKRVRDGRLAAGDRIRLGTTTLHVQGAPGGPK